MKLSYFKATAYALYVCILHIASDKNKSKIRGRKTFFFVFTDWMISHKLLLEKKLRVMNTNLKKKYA